MKVENNGLNAYNRTQLEGIRQADKEAHTSEAARAEGFAGKDQAILSERAQLLAKARAAFAEQPEIREEIVSDVRERIQAGKYEVKAESLADKLLANLLYRV
jgi:negative regulator of flagellin synthesis FlgM